MNAHSESHPPPHGDAPPPGTPEYYEWLADIGAEQTFPASDPPSTMDPARRERGRTSPATPQRD